MRKLNKNFFLAGLLLMTSLQFAPAFSIIGPGRGGGLGGDAWEKTVIGFGLNPGPYGTDVGTPKNIGEEFRRVTPVMYYAVDSSFLDFFGLAGTTNIDIAFAIMNGAMCGQTNSVLFLNSPTNGVVSGFSSDPYTGTPLVLRDLDNLNSYTTDLADFPLESQQINYTAQTLNLTDLKSETLELLVEQMGLTTPERYAWTLHDRYQPSGLNCPADMLYLVVQRNFDFIDSPLNQVQYSPYVNGTLYGYQIHEYCVPSASPYGPGNLSIALPVAVDAFADIFTAVASFTLLPGGFYTSLTRDDVGGLRYLYSTNNINYEATAPSGGLLITTNTTPPQLFGPTLSLAQLFLDASTESPAVLATNYPGLSFISVATNLVNSVNTNFSIFFTNLPPPYTNRVALSNGAAVYGSNGTVPFNYSPIQYANPPILVTTLPLGPLLALAPFTDPATLIALYPGLLIDHVVTNSFGVQVTTNVIPFFTNQIITPYFSNSATGVKLPILTSLTNIYYYTNQPGPTIVDFDRHSFLTITTLDLATFSDAAVTNDPVTLQTLYPGLQIISYSTFPKTLYITNFISYLTNSSGAPFSTPPIAVTRAISTNAYFGTVYAYQFGNVFTNHSHTNRYVRTRSIWLTNYIGAPFGTPSFTVTNDVYVKLPLVSGDFFIYPTNWCGFDLLLSVNPNPPNSFGPTNESDFQGYTSTSGLTYGLTNFVSDVYTNYLLAIRPGICEPVLRFGTAFSTNIVNQFQYDFINLVTNHIFTNTFVTVITTNISVTNSVPGGLSTNVTSTSYYTNLPSGDFFIIPTTWCGFQILGLFTNTVANTAVTLGTNAVASNGSQYSQTLVSEYTNYTFSIRPGICEPSLVSGTNFSTNIVNQYNYYFNNIVTNHYFTNGPVIVITTNLAVATNGLAGTFTNIVTVTTNNNGVGGDFYIIPPNLCDFTILATQLMTVITSTNTITATNVPGVTNVGQMFSITTISTYTNSLFLVQESTCGTATAPAALREGIGRIAFIRANFDSLLGRFFQPMTNFYKMTMVTNSQPVTEHYQRVITQPDFLLQAQDLTAGPDGPPAVGSSTRSLTFDTSTVLPILAGPGTIIPTTTIAFNRVGTIYANGSPNLLGLTTNAFLTQLTQGSASGSPNGLPVFEWASFDFSTNDPVVYPNGTSIANLYNQLFLQVTPVQVPDGTNGAPYTPVTFTATGGQPPYTFAAPNLSGLVPGLSFNPSTATLSGTPSATGTFSFTIQLTDAVNRTVNLNYSIVIH